MAIDRGKVLRFLCTPEFCCLAGLPQAEPQLRGQLDKEFADIKRAGDYLLLLAFSILETVLHLEFQKRPDPHMDVRVYHYQGAARSKHGREVVSAVLLVSGAQAVPLKAEFYVLGPMSRIGWVSISAPHLVRTWPERTDSPMAEVLRALLWPEPTRELMLDLAQRLRGLGLSDEDCRTMLTMLSFLTEIRLGGDGSRHQQVVDEVLTMLQLEDSWIYQAGARKGEAKGFRDGEAKGFRDGEATAHAKDVLLVLAARNIPMSEEVRAQILACTDRDRLQQYLARAAVASSAEEVLASGTNGK
jgi:hypothetical protein